MYDRKCNFEKDMTSTMILIQLEFIKDNAKKS